MTAIFKRELKSYLTSMVGYLFIFFVLVLTGIYFSAYQLSGGYSKFETTLSALTFVFLIGVPILSMGYRIWKISCTGSCVCHSGRDHVRLSADHE